MLDRGILVLFVSEGKPLLLTPGGAILLLTAVGFTAFLGLYPVIVALVVVDLTWLVRWLVKRERPAAEASRMPTVYWWTMSFLKMFILLTSPKLPEVAWSAVAVLLFGSLVFLYAVLKHNAV